MAKLPDLSHEGIGSLETILHNQGVADLSWLAVDEEEYHKYEALPKQNLDFIPEVQHALLADDKEKDGVPQLIPLRPHTIVNRNPLDGGQTMPVRDMSSPIRNRVAKLVMAGHRLNHILEQLGNEFEQREIHAAAGAIKEVYSERGLLGNVYVDASHFPKAASDPKERKLVQSLSRHAQFVIGGCQGKNGCPCHQTGFCKTFGGKRVVSEVPYGSNVVAHYAPILAAQKRPIQIQNYDVKSVKWKVALQQAFIRPIVATNADGVQVVRQQDKQTAPRTTAQDEIDFWNRRFESAAVERMPSPAYMKYARRMASGVNDQELLTASVDPELRALAGEFGLLGHTWLDMDAMGGCDKTFALMQEKNLEPDFVVRRSAKCQKCLNADDGCCSAIGRCSSIVSSKPGYDKQTFAFALRRAVASGRVSQEQMQSALTKASEKSNWGSLTRQANLIEAPVEDHSQYLGAQVSAYYGTRGNELGRVQVDPEEVRRTISHLMNTGLHGKDLQAAILRTYSRDDLVQVPQIGRRMASEDGVQGTYFIDPTAYNDYGKGCEQGAKQFRKRGAPHVIASGDCTGCTLQTSPGWCSKYSKTLIRSIPTAVRQHVASAKRQLPVIQTVPIVDLSQQFELSSEITIDTNGGKSRAINIELNGSNLDD